VIAVVWFQSILNGLGWVLSRLYDFIPNYGVSIIILTLAIRLLLLPLGVKQIRSMQATAVLQPKIKQLQQKYKGDRQAMNAELMKLYQEHGYNPLSGCFPLIAQLPVLIALFAVLQFPKGVTHIPDNSRLRAAILSQHTTFAGANLLCSAVESGRRVTVSPPAGVDVKSITKDCGHGIPVRIPYYLLSVLMVGATYYQQRQMQKVTPAGTNPQQQRMMRVMPLLFGFYGFIFPAGLVIYWTTTTLIQIGQQRVLLSRQPDLTPRAPRKEPPSKGDGARKARPGRTAPVRKRPGSAASGGAARGTRGRPGTGGQRSGGQRSGGKGSSAGGRTPRDGQRSDGGSGGRDAGDRKKRPKR